MGLVVTSFAGDYWEDTGRALFQMAGRANGLIQVRTVRFSLGFTLGFSKGAGEPPPGRDEMWRVGIVQNVLHEKNRSIWATIADGSWDEESEPIEVEFARPAVDSSAEHPFYGAEGVVLGNANLYQTPVVEITYGPAGFFRRGGIRHLTPSSPNEPFSVNMIDEPAFGCDLRDGNWRLKRAERIQTFGAWVVAIRPNKVHSVLAYVGPFSVVAAVETDPATFGSELIEPSLAAETHYLARGRVRTAGQSGGGPRGRLSAKWPGAGPSKPVMGGETATKRSLDWFKANVLS